MVLLLVSSLLSAQPLDMFSIPIRYYFGPNEYNGGIQNWAFDQDTSGVLFVANNYGVLRFDGSHWDNYDFPNSTRTRAIFVDKNNRIYAGGQGQLGYYEYDGPKLVFSSLLDRFEDDIPAVGEVWRIFRYRDLIAVNTDRALLLYDGDKVKKVNIPGTLQRAHSVGNDLILEITDKGLFTYENDTVYPVAGAQIIRDEVFSIIPTPDGFYSFTASGNIYRSSRNSTSLIRRQLSQMLGDINAAILLSNGDIAVGTQNQGLFILSSDLEIKANYTKNKGIDDRTVHAIYEDNFGNIWLGLNGGINYLEMNSPIRLINEEAGLRGAGYAAARHNNILYLGTNNGLFYYDKEYGRYTLVSGTEGQVYNLSVIRDNLLLGHHEGAFQVDGNNIIRIKEGGTWNFITSPSGEQLLSGGYGGVYYLNKENDGWFVSDTLQGLNVSSRVLEFENDSLLWMTHGYRGAYLIHLSSDLRETNMIEFFGENDGFPSNVLISVYKIRNQLVFTGERGIYNFNKDKRRFEINEFLTNYLKDSHVSALSEADNGDIYFTTTGNIGYLRQESLGKYSLQTSVFTGIGREINDDLVNINILDQSHVFIGAREGFILFDPSMEYTDQSGYDVVITNAQLRYKNDSLAETVGSYLDGRNFRQLKSVKFDFGSPYFYGMDHIMYASRMIGFENKWSDWQNEASREYINLPPGRYVFEVKARNKFGTESKVSRVAFTVQPKWYKSEIAYIFYTLIGMVSLATVLIVQERRFQRKTESISKEKEEQIKSKDEELSKVTRESAAKIEQLRNEKLRSEIQHKNTELASVTMHLLNKNEFMLDLRKKVEHALHDNVNSKEELKKMLKNIETNLRDDESWEQFSMHFDQVHGDFLKKLSEGEIKLTNQETKLAAYLRMNMTSKEIANLMNISVRGVELGRYRLRKKLGLERDQNLTQYLQQI